ncbi:hypothetical protein BY458DRAFT_500243 [Sporodiniella umbellata]|nr:hypothetical protein BY458DRAFT_500243 [Sporodiniella umbellata]
MQRLWHRLNKVPSRQPCIYCTTAFSRIPKTRPSLFQTYTTIETKKPREEMNKAFVAADLQRAFATQNIERIWPLYNFLYDNDMLDLLTQQNYYQLFTFTLRAPATKTNYFRLFTIVDDMKAKDVPLRFTEYNSLIAQIGNQPEVMLRPYHLSDALNLFDEMQKDKAIKPSVEIYNTLIALASRLSEYRTAQKLYRDMKTRGIEADVYTYTTLIRLLGKIKDVQGLQQIIEEAKSKLTPEGKRSVAFWNAQMLAYRTNALEEKAEAILSQLKRKARRKENKIRSGKWRKGLPSPDAESYRILIEQAILEKRPMAEPLALLRDMKAMSIKPFARIYNSLFRAFMIPIGETLPADEKTEKQKQLKKLFLNYKRDIEFVEPNSETVYTLVSGFLDLGEIKCALESFVFLNNYANRTMPETPILNLHYHAVAILAEERHASQRKVPRKLEIPKELLDRLREIVNNRQRRAQKEVRVEKEV